MLAKRFGLKKAPELRILDPDADEDKMGKLSLLKVLPNAMVYMKSATAFECMVTPPLLKKLTDEEEVAVIAHEVGHAASRHISKQMLINLAPTALAWAATYNFITAATLQGSTYAALGLATAASMCVHKVPSRFISGQTKSNSTLFALHAAC